MPQAYRQTDKHFAVCHFFCMFATRMMIDRLTVDKIKDAANIVDVVSEFVTLRKAGANYKGLCPFHNEKTPSFFVSPSRNTYHCFGCGKGGTPVNFIMEHEQMTYPEALRWLANKYHIEIKERELTDEERREQGDRESMFIVNQWANEYFQHQLYDTPDGQTIGKAYLRSRGFRDDTIRVYQLGYDATDRLALGREALAKGYQERYLTRDEASGVGTGICWKNDRGELIDRYAGRVIFPWISASGRVVGFTGRVLDSRTKGVNQKYVNSPDSEIYHKSNELYGLYQAKRAMAKEDRVYLVEGQADVISMHQSGIENVVAGSGTALTLQQIRLLRRFTPNVTLIYDNDPAGIHAALRGTDMLLAEGMSLRVLLLPQGEDPDSFARKHTPEEFKQYIAQHEADFIQFKTDLLLQGQTDPMKRSEGINSIVQSISYIHDPILRDTYVHDCAQRIGIAEATLVNQMNRFIRDARSSGRPTEPGTPSPIRETSASQQAVAALEKASSQPATSVELMITQMIVRYGERVLHHVASDEDGNAIDLRLAQFVYYNLEADRLSFTDALNRRILEEAFQHCEDNGFKAESYFINHDDIDISRRAIDLSTERYHVADSQQMTMGEEQLRSQIAHMLVDFRRDYVNQRLKEVQRQIGESTGDSTKMKGLMEEFMKLQRLRNGFATQLGSNIVL